MVLAWLGPQAAGAGWEKKTILTDGTRMARDCEALEGSAAAEWPQVRARCLRPFLDMAMMCCHASPRLWSPHTCICCFCPTTPRCEPRGRVGPCSIQPAGVPASFRGQPSFPFFLSSRGLGSITCGERALGQMSLAEIAHENILSHVRSGLRSELVRERKEDNAAGTI